MLSPMGNLGGPVDYAYPNARVMALKSFMLKDEDIKALASAKNLEEYVSLLEHTVYKKDISRITELDAGHIEELLVSNLVNMSRLSMNIAPKKTHEFFNSFLRIYETELLKFILNGFDGASDVKAGIDYSVYDPVLGSEMKEFVKEAAEAKNKDEAVNALKGTRYAFLPEMSAEETRIPGYHSYLLDRHYFVQLWDSISTLPENDASYARRLIGTEIDLTNMMMLLRSAACGCKAEKFLIPVNYSRANPPGRLAGKDLQEIISSLSGSSYGAVASEGFKSYEKDKSLLRLELDVKKAILEEYRRAFRGTPFHIGVLLGFLKLKEYEAKNLRAIAVSIENGMNSKDIMELVVT